MRARTMLAQRGAPFAFCVLGGLRAGACLVVPASRLFPRRLASGLIPPNARFFPPLLLSPFLLNLSIPRPSSIASRTPPASSTGHFSAHETDRITDRNNVRASARIIRHPDEAHRRFRRARRAPDVAGGGGSVSTFDAARCGCGIGWNCRRLGFRRLTATTLDTQPFLVAFARPLPGHSIAAPSWPSLRNNTVDCNAIFGTPAATPRSRIGHVFLAHLLGAAIPAKSSPERILRHYSCRPAAYQPRIRARW